MVIRMKKSKKGAIIASLILIIAGTFIALASLSMLEFDFRQLSTSAYNNITKDSEEMQGINCIEINMLCCNVHIVRSKNDKCRVSYNGNKSLAPSISVEGDTLKLETQDERKWYEHIGIFMLNDELTVYIPQNSCVKLYIQTASGNISIDEATLSEAEIGTSSGKIDIDNTTAEDLKLRTSSGKITCGSLTVMNELVSRSSSGRVMIDKAKAKEIDIKNSSGKVELADVITSGEIMIRTASGRVKMEDCDANTLDIETSSGSVSGSLLSEKIFITETSSGRVRVPQSTSGGKCKIKTSSGSINIIISE